MVYKIEKYQFGKGKKEKELCPLCLEELKKPVHKDCLPKGKVLIKKKNYALIKVNKKEPIIKRLLKISNNEQDYSTEFIILYVNKILVGYKSEDKLMFIPEFEKEQYKTILKEYAPRNKKPSNLCEIKW